MKTPISSLLDSRDETTAPSAGHDAHPDREQILKRLGDALFATDEILGILLKADARATYPWIEPQIRNIYDSVNELMKKLSE